MKKNTQPSIDGFVRRQAGGTLSGRSLHAIGQARQPIDATGETTQPISTQSARAPIRSDIDESLRAVDADDDDVSPKKRRLFRRRPKHIAPPSRRRKIIKRIGLIFLLIILVVAGYFGWKVLLTGSKIFQGNLLGVFQHQRLREDANGRTNVLIFGTSGWSMEGDDWDGALLTDSIMVVSVDQDTNDAYTISLPRDMYVGTCTATGKLNETYWCAQQAGKSDEEAAKAFAEVAGTILGLEVQYYVHANWKALVQGVNAVGGVDVKIEGTGGQGIYDVATGIRYREGEIAHMNGEKALAFARARGSEGGYGLDGSNFAREKNQQRLLAALQKKATSASVLANPAAVAGLLDALGDNLRTNFQAREVQALIDIARNTSNITSLPFVGRPNGEPDLMDSTGNPVAGRGNYTEIQAYIRKSLQGDKVATVDVLNGSGVMGLAQTKADELAARGYTISAVENAPKKISTRVVIYQLDESKTTAAKVFEEKYGVTVKTEKLSGYTPSKDAEFIIIFGDQSRE